MNELYIPNAHIYFKSNDGNAEDVFRQLQDLCFHMGIELSMTGQVLLRDENGDDIDYYEEA